MESTRRLISARATGPRKFLIISGIGICVCIFSVPAPSVFYVVGLFLIIGVGVVIEDRRRVVLCYEGEAFYVLRDKKETEVVSFMDVVSIKQMLTSYDENEKDRKYGYRMVYINRDGEKQRCRFLIATSRDREWEGLLKRIKTVNHLAVIDASVF